MTMRRQHCLLALGLGWTLLVLAAPVIADAKSAGKATGTWKSSFTTQNGQTRETTFKLKQEGDKLTGVVVGPGGQETAIEDGTVKDGKVSFQVSRERNGQKFTMKYNGTVEGDTIKGKMEFNRGDQSRSRDWEAKRQ